jgi:hypothetical protein
VPGTINIKLIKKLIQTVLVAGKKVVEAANNKVKESFSPS